MQPFVVSLDTLSPEGQTYTLEVAPGELGHELVAAGVDDVVCVAPLGVEERVLLSGGEVFVIGDFRTRVRYRCVRCLAPFEDDVEGQIHVAFTRDSGPEGDLELHTEDLELEFLHQGELDLTRIVVEHLLLALRSHPVCRETCAGLCPRCGEDLNESECGCPKPAADPRFSALETWGKKH